MGGLIILVSTCCVVISLFELEFLIIKLTALCGVVARVVTMQGIMTWVLCL